MCEGGTVETNEHGHKQLTEKELWEKQQEWDFSLMLEPYKEGGTETHPVERTFGTILDYLLNRKKYSPEVAGAAILLVFMEMRNGKRFLGDGSYGSPGRELITAIRVMCDKLNQRQLQGDMYQRLAEARMEEMKAFIESEVLTQTMPEWGTPWYKRGPYSAYRKWRKVMKEKASQIVEAVNESL
jgi:hypothetical protein